MSDDDEIEDQVGNYGKRKRFKLKNLETIASEHYHFALNEIFS